MKIFLLSMVFILTVFKSISQNAINENFLGINPSVTIEPFYEKGELDLNVFPLVYQRILSNRIDFRLSTTVNYGFRTRESKISHLGGQLAIPFFLGKPENMGQSRNGIFLAPGIGYTRNRLEKHTNIGFWMEPGYHLLVNEQWAFSFGAQFGATNFQYDNGTSKWGNHFGMKIIFGKWF